MSTIYPNAVDAYTVKIDNTHDVRAAHINDLQDAVVAIETVLGVNPQGDSGTVAARLAAAPQNVLLNGGFTFAQRQTPGLETVIADNGYSADRWRVSRENADLRYARLDAGGEEGLTARYFGKFVKATNAGKILVCQIVEGANTAPLRARTVVFQAKLRSNAGRAVRMGFIELGTSGTLDVLTGALVAGWGAAAVDPTWGANLALLPGAQRVSVTPAWQNFAVRVTVPWTSRNLICAVWSDSALAAGDWLAVAEAGLYDGATLRPWLPRPVGEELLLCQRYFEKSYAVDTAPGTATDAGVLVNGAQTGWIPFQPTTTFLVSKRAVPVVAIYNLQDGSVAQSSEYDGSGIFVANRPVTAVYVGTRGAALQSTNGTFGAGNFERWHYVAQAEL